MALGILTAGFLKGAADNVSGTIAQAAEEAREDRLIEEEREYQRGVTKQEQDFRRKEREAGEEAQRLRDFDLALNEATMFRMQQDAEEQVRKEQRRDEIEDAALKDLQNIKEQQRVQAIIDKDPNATIAYDPSIVNISRPAKSTAGKTEPGAVLWDFSGDLRIAPSVDRENTTSKEAVNDAFNYLRAIPREEIEGAIELHRKGMNKKPFNNLVSYMMRYTSAELTDLLRVSDTNESNAGQFLYENPLTKFGIDKLLPNVQDQKYFYEQFFEKAVPALSGTVHQALGIPRVVDLGIEFDEDGNPYFILPDSSAYSWATDNGELDETVEKLAIDISQKSKIPVLNVLGMFSRMDAPRETRINAMREVVELRESLKGQYQDMPKGRMRIFAGFDDELTPALQAVYSQARRPSQTQNAADGVQNGIQRGVDLVRTLLPPPKRAALGLINVDAQGRPDFENKYYLGKYGIDVAQAGQKAGFAQDTLALIKDIRLAQKDGGLIGAGGQLITIAEGVNGFVRGMGDILSRMQRDNVNMDQDVRVRLETLQNQTTSILDQDQVQAQGVMNYLIEALAFAIAGSLQGGAKGNNISNQDIQNVKAGLGMGKLFSSEAIANGTLDYLENKMMAVYEVNRQFANASNEQDFRSVYVYNMLMGHSYDKDLMGSSYDFFRNDTSNPVFYEQEGRAAPGDGADITDLLQMYPAVNPQGT